MNGRTKRSYAIDAYGDEALLGPPHIVVAPYGLVETLLIDVHVGQRPHVLLHLVGERAQAVAFHEARLVPDEFQAAFRGPAGAALRCGMRQPPRSRDIDRGAMPHRVAQ